MYAYHVYIYAMCGSITTRATLRLASQITTINSTQACFEGGQITDKWVPTGSATGPADPATCLATSTQVVSAHFVLMPNY